ncbi:MAG: SMP-30/gluconolactonase/LRE family protein [Bacteroidota bacterium]
MKLPTPYHFLVYLALFCLGSLSACQLKTSQQTSPEKDEVNYLAKDFTPEHEFTSGIEGPATDIHGNIYVVNFEKQGTIGLVSSAGTSNLFVSLPEGSIGNGIRLTKEGNLLVADYMQHNVLFISASTKEITVLANNDSMNQPNDLAMMENGILFASDPNWGDSTGNIWRINLDGSTDRLERNMGTTNGIEVSPDESTLYVNESIQRTVWAYDLTPEGKISNKRLLIQFPDFGMDGMRCDIEGNLYITRYGKGTVVIISPNGEELQEIQLTGTKPSNISFGGKDGKSCYITLQDRGCLETFRTEYAGREWQMKQP